MNDQNEQDLKEHAEGQSRLNDGFAVMLEKMERDAFEKWWARQQKDPTKPITPRMAWDARAALQKPCRGVEHNGCNYLAPCGSICNKCGQAV